MTNYPTDPADILEAAADLLETTGWTKGAYARNKDGDHADEDSPAQIAESYCAAGAIRRVAGCYDFSGIGRTSLFNNATDIERMLAKQVGFGSLPAWNDQPERKAHQVIDLMKHTAKDLRNRREAA